MNLRQEREELEKIMLKDPRSWSVNSKGRDYPDTPCDLRTCYQRDRDRILHCKSFRRMKHKTQVFIAPEGDHYRTRLTHTLEVSQIARTIARSLRLNEDLVEAIALGHDIGHTPFGHAGERVLQRLCRQGFSHYEQGVRVVEKLENGKGLNLTWEVRNGIASHSMSRHLATEEGKVVRLADKIAYINHDIDDALRGQIIQESDLPREPLRVLGYSFKERIDRMIHNVISTSLQEETVTMSPETEQAMMELRASMFQNVYLDSEAKKEEKKAEQLIESLFLKMMEDPSWLPVSAQMKLSRQEEEREVLVCDYIASMSDNYAMRVYQDMFMPRGWDVL